MQDLIDRQEAIRAFDDAGFCTHGYIVDVLKELPSAQQIYTDEEIQKMQDLESAEIEKAYQLGYEDGKKDAQPERPEQPESAREYCAECIHIEVCRAYPYEGCEFRSLPSAQAEYEPVTSEDFAKTMSENTVYQYMVWYGVFLTLMKEQGFVICKKTM